MKQPVTTAAHLDHLLAAASSEAFFDNEGHCLLCAASIVTRVREPGVTRFEQLLAHRSGCPVRELRRALAPFNGSDQPLSQGALL